MESSARHQHAAAQSFFIEKVLRAGVAPNRFDLGSQLKARKVDSDHRWTLAGWVVQSRPGNLHFGAPAGRRSLSRSYEIAVPFSFAGTASGKRGGRRADRVDREKADVLPFMREEHIQPNFDV